MKKRIITLALAIIMVFQTIMPVAGFAKENTPEQNKMVKVGTIDIKSYPQLDAKIVQDAIRRKKLESKRYVGKIEGGAQLFSSPYFPNQDPDDNLKPLIFANINAIFTTKGLDGGNFDWEGVFGKDSDGKLNKAQIVFEQLDDKTSTRTGVKFFLKVDKDGTYTWSDSEGKATKLPLYSTDLKPYKYEVLLDEDVSDHVKLLTSRFFGTSGGYKFGQPDPITGEIVGNINLDLTLQQIASTKFTSKWNTDVVEADRPTVEGSFLPGNETDPEMYGIFKFPNNDTDKTIIRNDQLDPQNPAEYSEYLARDLEKTPKVGVADPDPDATDTYTIDRDTSRISYKGKNYKYEVEYDVINGGKLTMTEIIPVTFDANGGKFASIADSSAEQKIVKEVEYDGNLTEKAEDPTKDRETFKGWSTTSDGKTPATDADFKNITEAKTFYAIWDNNDIVAKELEVKESFKDGTKYVNDFIPTLETLKGQVKINDENGDPQALEATDTFEILNDSDTAITGDDLKDYLYEKLKEKDNPNGEPTRVETVKAKVTHANNTSQEVTIPIKVIKNIYEAKTLTEKPFYVPEDYVKVTVDPTTKATDPQKTYYYVNKEAKVVIPGENPIGTGDNTFVKWIIKGNTEEYKLTEKPRHQFSGETIIEAQYESDVIPQDGPNKPDTVPANFVEVKFVPTDKATDETKAEKIYWVNPEKEVTIPVKDPVGKTYYTFKEWKLGADANGDKYTPSTPKKFTEETTITATYDEAKNIIPYNPEEPITRPDGYVRVTFAADPGLKLTEQKAYYVKKNAGITLGNAELVKPAYKEETGYKFKEWDKKNNLVIEAADIVVTAKATSLDDVVPKTKQDETEKPAGYVTVKFVSGANGKLKDGETEISDKTFFVNPNKYVKLVPPTALAKGNTGFEFGSWDKDATIPTVYEEKVTTITAKFNPINAVIPKVDKNTTKPDGYVEVSFVIDKVEGKDPATFVEGQVATYFVDPNRNVKIQPPTTKANTGYKFVKWDKDTTTDNKYTQDTTVKATFEKLEDIYEGSEAKPEGYVTVTFDKGEHGKVITGQTRYYVNPKANPAKTLGDSLIKKPTVKAEVGYKFTGWNFADTKEILSDITVIAQYKDLDDVIPKTKDDESEKPDGYITVKFSTETNGKIKGTDKTEKIVYVNPNKAVVLKGFDPEVTPNTGFDFADWDTQIVKKIQYSKGDTIKALYNAKDDVIPQGNPDGSDKPAGYLTITFDKGANGELSGKTVYYVKPNKEVTVPAPTVKPNIGFEFEKWDKELTQTFAEDTTITAGYKALDNIIPQKNADGTDKPEGYHTVTFKPDANGSLSGTLVYYVKPNVEVDLTNTADGITKNPNIGYTADGGTWNPVISKKQYTADETYTFKFKALPDVITAGNNVEQPKGYVKVEFIAGVNGKLVGGNKTYYVNPTKNIKVGSINLPIPKPQANNGYEFLRWAESIDENEVINGNKKFEAIFIPIAKYPDNPNPDYPGYPNYPNYPDRPYVPIYPEVRHETIVQEKIVEVPAKAKALRKEVRYMQGFNGYFRPEDGLTRAEAAQILANALVEDGFKYTENFKIPYKDVKDEWYTRAIRIVTEAKVFAGYDDGLFRPEKKITRNEWIATLKRFQELGDVVGNHMKLNDKHWAKREIEAAFNEGWLSIYTDGLANFKGDEFIPREEVAAVSNRAFNRVLDKDYIENNINNLITYKDVDKSRWSYYDILCASNTFIYQGGYYRAHWIKQDNDLFNVNINGIDILKAEFQRNPR